MSSNVHELEPRTSSQRRSLVPRAIAVLVIALSSSPSAGVMSAKEECQMRAAYAQIAVLHRLSMSLPPALQNIESVKPTDGTALTAAEKKMIRDVSTDAYTSLPPTSVGNAPQQADACSASVLSNCFQDNRQ